MGITVSGHVYFGVPIEAEYNEDEEEDWDWEAIYIRNKLGITEPKYIDWPGSNKEWDSYNEIKKEELKKLTVEISFACTSDDPSYYIVAKGSEVSWEWGEEHTPLNIDEIQRLIAREEIWIRAIEEFARVMKIEKVYWQGQPDWYLTARYW